jgi:lipopolysaccharide transport system permease protein
MVGVVDGFRWALLGVENSSGSVVLVSASIVVILLVGGLVYFKRMEDQFADVI